MLRDVGFTGYYMDMDIVSYCFGRHLDQARRLYRVNGHSLASMTLLLISCCESLIHCSCNRVSVKSPRSSFFFASLSNHPHPHKKKNFSSHLSRLPSYVFVSNANGFRPLNSQIALLPAQEALEKSSHRPSDPALDNIQTLVSRGAARGWEQECSPLYSNIDA